MSEVEFRDDGLQLPRGPHSFFAGQAMVSTMLNTHASNWVDRGDAPNATLERVLSRLLNRNVEERREWFREQSNIVVGMMAADATEVHLVGFLRSLFDETTPPRDSSAVRAAAIALWHIAKAALVRDFAERVLRGEVPANTQTPDSLSHWLATRILTPEELRDFENEADE